MKPQNYEARRAELVAAFDRKLVEKPGLKDEEIKRSWSNWGFGVESLEETAARLERHRIRWIELHGKPDPALLDKLVAGTVACWRKRESQIKSR